MGGGGGAVGRRREGGGGVINMSVIRMSVATVTASPAAKI